MNQTLASLESILAEAVEIESTTNLDAFLDKACADNLDLRAEVKRLLANHHKAGSFLEHPAVLGVTLPLLPLHEAPVTPIGPYKILEQIGEGGMGLVYVAEQLHPVRRQVALKLIKPGMDSKQVIARFEAERQALALMDHPNIAKVLDAGTTSTSRPYFVMELVRGIPITEYCDQAKFTIRQRLELFIQVCRAVQHAHTKGIIHRDIKPSNVLVTSYDGVPVPMVIDFGLAKALGQQLTEHTLHTGFAQMVGTPLYMSPEQAEFNQFGVDTRSDVYSLGVLLYELLTGVTPFDRARLISITFDEFRRILCEEEPPRPSTRLSTLEGAALSTTSERRCIDSRKLSQTLHGELDWILLKSLDKDRTRRYETASAFANDVQRYLNNEAVEACPPSAGYRLQKFVRRHKGTLAVTAGVLALVLVVVGSLGWVVRDREYRAAQEQSERLARAVETERAVNSMMNEADQLQKQRKIQDALSKLKQAKAILDSGANSASLSQRVQQRLTDLTLVADLDELRLLRARGTTTEIFDNSQSSDAYARRFREFGIDLEALTVEESAKRIRQSSVILEIAAFLDNWSMFVKKSLQAPQLPAEGLRQRLLVIACEIDPDPWRTKLRDALKQNHIESLLALVQVKDLPTPTAVALAAALSNKSRKDEGIKVLRAAHQRDPSDFWINFDLAIMFRDRTPPQFDEAIRFFTSAIALRPDSPVAHNLLGLSFANKRRLQEALTEYQEAVRLNPNYAMAHNNVGTIYCDLMHDYDGAIACFREAIRLNPVKSEISLAYANLGRALRLKGEPDSAIEAFHEAIRLHPKNVFAHIQLGSLLCDVLHDYDGSIAAFKEVLRFSPDNSQAHYCLGNVLQNKGQEDEAIAEYCEAIRIEPDHPEAHCNLGQVLLRSGQFHKAVEELRRGHELGSRNSDWPYPSAQWLRNAERLPAILQGTDQPKDAKERLAFAELCYLVGRSLQNKDRQDEAIAAYQRAVQFRKEYAEAHFKLGDALCAKGQMEEGIAEFRETLRLDKNFAWAHNELGIALCKMGRFDEGIAEFREVLRLEKDDADALCNLGQALRELGQFAEALTFLRRGHELGSKKSRWPYPSAQWVMECEHLAELDTKLPAILSGKEQPANADERVEYAMIFRTKRMYTASVRYYAEAFAVKPELITLLGIPHRYNAACAAVLASSGAGKDAAQLTDVERANLRQQARDWLRAELTMRNQIMEKGLAKDRETLATFLQHWLVDSELASVRDESSLARLPMEEKQAWLKFWAEVQETLRKAKQKPIAKKKAQ